MVRLGLTSLTEALPALLGAYHLRASRAVLRLSGRDTEAFLQVSCSAIQNKQGLHRNSIAGPGAVQGLLTNDVAALQLGQSQYAALLNGSGRVLHDLFLHRVAGSADTFLCDVSRDSAQDVLRLLRRYRLRAKVDLAEVSSEYSVWASSWSASMEEGQASSCPAWPLDPRLPELGRRAILHEAEGPSGGPGGGGGEAGLRLRRHQLGVAEGDTEIPAGAAIPLEYNLEALNAISFSKGCYVGQELVARTHFRGAVRKRVVPVTAAAGELDSQQDILQLGVAKPVGRLLAGSDTSGLAMLRLAALQGPGLALADSGRELQAQQPAWWPPQWTAT